MDAVVWAWLLKNSLADVVHSYRELENESDEVLFALASRCTPDPPEHADDETRAAWLTMVGRTLAEMTPGGRALFAVSMMGAFHQGYAARDRHIAQRRDLRAELASQS